MSDNSNPELMKAQAQAVAQFQDLLGGFGNSPIASFLGQFAMAKDNKIGRHDITEFVKSLDNGPLAQSNAVSRQFRANSRAKQFKSWQEGVGNAETRKAIRKSALDVGSLTNLANVVGGQALGYVSLDTQVARGTVRPKSFTLYNALHKTACGNIVDYWPYASSIGAGLPGTAFGSFSNAAGLPLQYNSGSYNLNYINLKLAVDGRAITMALAQQNSFVNVGEQENANAALTILQSVDWCLYWGNPTNYPNQPLGVAQQIIGRNIVDFSQYYASAPVQALGISQQQALFNLIYEQAGYISSYRQNGQFTHAFMPPTTAGDLQSLVTTNLRNISNDITTTQREARSIVVNGDLVGMNTRFGDVQFPIDFFITARDIPAVAIVLESGGNLAQPTGTLSPPTVAATAVPATGAAASGSQFTGSYAGGSYTYAVATCDQYMNESVLGYSSTITVASGGAGSIVITPGANGTPQTFRVYRSGIGYTGGNSNPAAFRFVGEILATGSAVTFVDINTHIPGSDTIFLLDMDDEDNAIDYRVMLPLSKIELFAQNLYMPWAVAHIGAPRLRVAKWHGYIKNYVAINAQWSPLSPNNNASV